MSTPKLSDIISGLVASMARARTVADLEALRIAYHYRQNEFLKGLPIPRLRLQKVSISLPVIVTDLVPGQNAVARPAVMIAQRVKEALLEEITKTRGLFETQEYADSQDARQKRHLARFLVLLDQLREVVSPPTAGESDSVRDLPPSGAPSGPSADPVKAESSARPAAPDVIHMLTGRIEQAYARIGAADEISEESDRVVAADTEISQAVAVEVRQTMHEILREACYRTMQQEVQDPQPKDGEAAPAEAKPVEPTETKQNRQFDPNLARRWYSDTVSRDPQFIDFVERVCIQAGQQAVVRPTQSPDFVVSVNTDAIKTTGGGEQAITRLHLVMHEEGLEWVQETSADGSSRDRLMPE